MLMQQDFKRYFNNKKNLICSLTATIYHNHDLNKQTETFHKFHFSCTDSYSYGIKLCNGQSNKTLMNN